MMGLLILVAFLVQAKEPSFEKVRTAPIQTEVFNEIYGDLTKEWRLRSFATTRHYCVFKFNERFLSMDGSVIRGMTARNRGAFLVMANNDNCRYPKLPLIRVDGMNIGEVVREESTISAILARNYTGEYLEKVKQRVPVGAVPSSIIRSGDSRFIVLYSLPSEFLEVELSAQGVSAPLRIVRISAWQ